MYEREIIVYKGYRMTKDWHTHTVYSHGKGSIRDNVIVARKRGLEEIAITDHGPKHLTYGIKMSAIPNMKKDIEEIEKEFSDIKVKLSVEANIICRENYLDIKKDEASQFDFIIGGYHYGVFNGYCIENFTWEMIRKIKTKRGKVMGDFRVLKKKNTDMIIKSLYENKIKILTHPADKAPVDIEAIADACVKTGTLMEISTHHEHLTIDEIRKIKKKDVSFVISSDAHHPSRVGDFRSGIDKAISAGLDLERVVNIEKV